MTEAVRPVGQALDVKCPRCGAEPKAHCAEVGGKVPPHVERGRHARWQAMGVPAAD